MQAIQTRYLSATNSRGSRIKAWCYAGSATISYPHELSGMECHMLAAKTLQSKLSWTDKLVGGQLPNGDYCFIVCPSVNS